MKLSKTIFIWIIFFIANTTIHAQDADFFTSKDDTTAFVQIIQDPDIDVINKLYKEESSSDTLTDGFRIQIYYGSRIMASTKRVKFQESFPEIKSKLIYEEPNFKTVIGSYQTKLDADRELVKIRKEFIDAFIIRNKIRRE